MRNLAAFKGLRFGRLGSLLASTPLAFLFATREPGVWLDPSDLTTLFQDSAGTIPVTTPGQPVGLVLDKSKGLALGLDLVTNGDFSDGLTGWADVSTAPATISVVGGSLQLVSDGVARAMARSSQATVVGRTYRVTFVVLSGTVEFNCGTTVAGTEYFGGGTFSAGTYTRLILATATTMHIQVHKGAAGTGIASGVSVRELSGNHAIQTTSAARPTYGIEPEGGRRNLLNMTDNLAGWTLQATPDVTSDGTLGGEPAFRLTDNDTTRWEILLHQYTANTLRSGNYVVSIRIKKETTASSAASFRVGLYTGGGPTEYSGAVINPISGDVITGTTTWPYGNRVTSVDDMGTYWQVTMRFTVSSGHYITSFQIFPAHHNLTMSNPGVTNVGSNTWAAPQLEVGSTPTAYQRVTSQYNITEVGKNTLHYIQFDGVDDFLVTPTIAPGTDKAQVFAGVRKLSDAALGMVAELGTNVPSVDGSLGLQAPGTVATANMRFSSQGTSRVSPSSAASFPAPVTVVLTGLGDISGDLATLRVNGIQAAQSTTDQGTGDYLAYPLYIGRRGGATQHFNGHIYGLVTRFGTNLNESQIKQVESLLAQKTGVTI